VTTWCAACGQKIRGTTPHRKYATVEERREGVAAARERTRLRKLPLDWAAILSIPAEPFGSEDICRAVSRGGRPYSSGQGVIHRGLRYGLLVELDRVVVSNRAVRRFRRGVFPYAHPAPEPGALPGGLADHQPAGS
jgi:hypothetical protein